MTVIVQVDANAEYGDDDDVLSFTLNVISSLSSNCETAQGGYCGARSLNGWTVTCTTSGQTKTMWVPKPYDPMMNQLPTALIH